MENFTSDWELKNVVKELSQGRELAMQLQNHLNVQSSSSHETREFLLHKILYSYDKALSMLKHSRPGDGGSGDAPPPGANLDSSPASLAGSPRSDDDSDQDNFKDNQASRKRKAVPRWTQKVNVSPGTGIEGQFDDGYAWRKYGQKDILGAKHPRGYYRCTHRHGQGCLATKQVQRSDEDPNIFEITYRRKHTCTPRANPSNNNSNPLIPQPDPQNEGPRPLIQNPHQFVEGPSQQIQPHEPLFNIQTSLKVITQDLGPNENPSFDSFNFPPSPTIINSENNHNNILNSNNISENYSSNLSNYLPTNFMNDDYGGLIPNLQISESELSPIVAAMNISSTNSSTIGTHFQFGSSEFGSDFGFGNPGYYP
ncbi:hypothetical protein DH2020_030930 [Rehmannia glutinosa]|uniref:WRKY domain-containing protein n=1 Tax=Rehmannia glutinosa TaxID=99300 RepID=A0ABR0VMV3_REHGL